MLSDFLASLHTRRAAYRGISLALLGISIFFAVRNGEMYISLLQHFGAFAATWEIPGTDITVPIGQIGMVALQVLLTVTFVYLGFYLSTHQSYVLEAQLSRIQRRAKATGADATKELKAARSTFNWIIWFVIASDVASAMYVILASLPNLRLASFTDITLDGEVVGALVAWSFLVFAEFKIGPFLLALSETLPAEDKQELAVTGIKQIQGMKHKALAIVTKAAREMDLPRAMEIIQRSAQRQIDQEGDPVMQDFLRELHDIARPDVLSLSSVQPAYPALQGAEATRQESEREEPPNTITDGRQPIISPDKLQRTIAALTVNPDIADDDLAEMLDLKKASSARYWRLKALEFLRIPAVTSNGHTVPERREDAAERRPFPGTAGWEAQKQRWENIQGEETE